MGLLMAASPDGRHAILRGASQKIIVKPHRLKTDGRVRLSFSFRQADGDEKTDDHDAARCGI